MIDNLLRYWHTIRYLKPVQLYGRVLFRLRRPTADLHPAPPLRDVTGPWVTPALRTPRLIGPSRVCLLNREGDVRSPADWNADGVPKLWLYNLHYFDDLSATGGEQRVNWQRALVIRWIAENPPGKGNGWEPYPTSLRIVNWVKWARSGAQLPAGFADSLAVQARWLSKRVEYHLLANHLFVNAKALVVAGLWFRGPEASEWLRTGLGIIERQLPMQLHTDGGHIEASPMYHALLLEDLLDLINISASTPGVIEPFVLDAWREAAGRMLPWLRAMTHPDGEISFFNDAAFGIAPTAGDLASYATRLGLPEMLAAPKSPGDSGYVRAECGGAVLIADVAMVGADYQPGHAHADTLSFELSLNEERLIVNSGTSTYDVGPQRNFERSTAAHSTVVIDGANSTDVWGGFRVARRARPFNVSAVRDRDGEVDVTIVRGAHDGYRHRAGGPLHYREWRLTAHGLTVTDTVTGAESAVARFYLHPDIVLIGERTWRMRNGTECRWAVTGGTPRLRDSQWYPEFGRSIANRCLEIEITGQQLITEFAW